MNLNVALCDNEIEIFQRVQRLFQEFSKENNVQIRIDWFSSGESLLECLEDYPLILLDIAIPEMDGIAFGREAMRRKYSGKIIMLTGELERFTEAFEIQAFRFVIKPIEKEKLFKCLRLEGSNFRLGGIAPITRAVPSFRVPMRLAVSVAWQKGN